MWAQLCLQSPWTDEWSWEYSTKVAFCLVLLTSCRFAHLVQRAHSVSGVCFIAWSRLSIHNAEEHHWIRLVGSENGGRKEEVLTHAVFLAPSLPCYPSLLLAPVHLTVQTPSRALLMTRAEVSATGEATLRRSLNRRSCASASPLVPSCHGDGCADCHCENGGVHGDEGGWGDGWGVRNWCSTG